jgi:hypothetical protein
MTQTTRVPITRLPGIVHGFLTAHAVRDVDRALKAFHPSAEVTDESRTYRGADAVRTFLQTGGAEFTYTTVLLSAQRVDDAVWIAHNRIEGDFPGGVADLAYRFELADGLISRLDITS